MKTSTGKWFLEKTADIIYIYSGMNETRPPKDTITFLGTGAGRFMITSQKLASGGLWMNLGGTQLLIDPGPGCIVRSTRKKFDAEKLSAIIVSHRHLDHSADVNIMTEAMTKGGHNQHGMLFAPTDAIDTEPVIFGYLKQYLNRIEKFEEGKTYTIENVSLTVPVKHHHGVETYGMILKSGTRTISYIADTRFFEGLLHHYGGDLLILNVVFTEPRPPSGNPLLPTDHLSVPDAELIIRTLKPKTAIISHFGMGMWKAHPQTIAAALTEKTGIPVLAAKDGMQFNLAELN